MSLIKGVKGDVIPLPVELVTKILFKIDFPLTRNQLLCNILLGELYKTTLISSAVYLKSKYKRKIYRIYVYKNDNIEVFNNLHKNIRYLNLFNNPLLDINLLIKCLKVIPKLTHLYLCNINDIGLKSVSDNFKYISNLKVLDLYDNNITDIGLKLLSDNLKYITNLCDLNLSNNDITDVGLKCFSKNLKYIPKLSELDLWHNEITKKGVKYLLSKQVNLRELYIHYIPVDYEKLKSQYPHITFHY